MTRVCGWLLSFSLASSFALAQTPPGEFPAAPAPGLPSNAPPRDAAPKTSTARIRGRVVAADTGQPLRKVLVRATSAELRENRSATTDDKGTYEISELPAGRYQVGASKGSFVQLQDGQTRPFEPGRPIEILDGRTVEKIDFSLPRGAVVTGRVLDEIGEPTTDVQISVMRYQYQQGRRQLVNVGRFATTNDLGEYRIYGLAPGQYYVTATYRGANMFDNSTGGGDRSGYAPTYYPGTSNVAEAQRVNVELGQSRGGVDVTLQPTRLSRVTGSVVDSDGKPVITGSLLVIQSMGTGFSGIMGGQIRPDGTFILSNLAPGEYTLGVSGSQGSPVFGSGDLISANVTVSGEDITGLRLIGLKPSTVSGRVVLPQATAGGLRPASIQLAAYPLQPTPIGGGSAVRVNDDLTFEMKVQPGQRVIRLATQNGLPPGVSQKAVRLNGTDLSDTGIEVRPNEDISGLEVELTTQQSELSGAVLDARGQPAQDYSVIVFARDSTRWTPGTRYAGNSRPDQDGRFKVRGLPAGEYYAIALDYIEPGAGSDPEFLERVRNRASTFALNDGQVISLDLKLVSGP